MSTLDASFIPTVLPLKTNRKKTKWSNRRYWGNNCKYIDSTCASHLLYPVTHSDLCGLLAAEGFFWDAGCVIDFQHSALWVKLLKANVIGCATAWTHFMEIFFSVKLRSSSNVSPFLFCKSGRQEMRGKNALGDGVVLRVPLLMAKVHLSSSPGSKFLLSSGIWRGEVSSPGREWYMLFVKKPTRPCWWLSSLPLPTLHTAWPSTPHSLFNGLVLNSMSLQWVWWMETYFPIGSGRPTSETFNQNLWLIFSRQWLLPLRLLTHTNFFTTFSVMVTPHTFNEIS